MLESVRNQNFCVSFPFHVRRVHQLSKSILQFKYFILRNVSSLAVVSRPTRSSPMILGSALCPASFTCFNGDGGYGRDRSRDRMDHSCGDRRICRGRHICRIDYVASENRCEIDDGSGCRRVMCNVTRVCRTVILNSASGECRVIPVSVDCVQCAVSGCDGGLVSANLMR